MENNQQKNQKTSKGKRKIAIEPITNKTRKQVTFSKRRGGLFKKASELCSLCGSQIAVITFSEAGKLFSFGHPNADYVINRFLINDQNPNQHHHHNHDYVGDDDVEYQEILRQIEAERKEEENSTNENDPRGDFWWNRSIDDLDLVELEKFKVDLESLRNRVASRVDEINRYSSINNNNNINLDISNNDGDNDNLIIGPQNFDFGQVYENMVVSQGFDWSSCSKWNGF